MKKIFVMMWMFCDQSFIIYFSYNTMDALFVHPQLSANATENLRIVRDDVTALQQLRPSGIHSEHTEILNMLQSFDDTIHLIGREVFYLSAVPGLVRLLSDVRLLRAQYQISRNAANTLWSRQQRLNAMVNQAHSLSYNESYDLVNDRTRRTIGAAVAMFMEPVPIPETNVFNGMGYGLRYAS